MISLCAGGWTQIEEQATSVELGNVRFQYVIRESAMKYYCWVYGGSMNIYGGPRAEIGKIFYEEMSREY